jgi:hypothetical protein
MKQTYLYLWYSLFQAQCDEINKNTKLKMTTSDSKGQDMKQTYLYLWYSLFQAQCDEINKNTKLRMTTSDSKNQSAFLLSFLFVFVFAFFLQNKISPFLSSNSNDQ